MSAEPPLKAPDSFTSFTASLRRRSKMLPSMTRPRKRQLAQGVVFIVAMLLSGRITLARDPALDISQYAHTARTVQGGFSLGNTRDNVPFRLPLIERKDIRFTHYSTEQGLYDTLPIIRTFLRVSPLFARVIHSKVNRSLLFKPPIATVGCISF